MHTKLEDVNLFFAVSAEKPKLSFLSTIHSPMLDRNHKVFNNKIEYGKYFSMGE